MTAHESQPNRDEQFVEGADVVSGEHFKEKSF